MTIFKVFKIIVFFRIQGTCPKARLKNVHFVYNSLLQFLRIEGKYILYTLKNNLKNEHIFTNDQRITVPIYRKTWKIEPELKHLKNF